MICLWTPLGGLGPSVLIGPSGRWSVLGSLDLIEPPPASPINSKCTCKSKFKCNFHFKQIANEIVNAHATCHEHENANAHINKKT